MAPRRGNTLPPPDLLSPNSPLPSPRSASPSSGFTHFLSKPSKWFSRSASASKPPSSNYEPRPSLSGGRKHKISHPTDPRPILDNAASRSVFDLSIRTQGSVELSRLHGPSSSSSSPTGLGDLRNISRKGWSKSADDLSKISLAEYSPVKPSFQERIVEYRNRSRSNASSISPSSASNGRHIFPSSSSTPPSSSPPRVANVPSVSISVSAPVLDNGPIPPPNHVHTRSQSFTPKLPSKLAIPQHPPSPRNASPSTIDREYGARDDRSPITPPTRVGFGFGLGGQNHTKTMPDSNAVPSPTSHRATTLMLPPSTILPPHNQEVEEKSSDMKRSSQIVFHSGFINRLADAPSNFHQAHSFLSKGWKPYKVELKGSKMYFYKPPGDRAAAVKELFPTTLIAPSEEDTDEVDSERVEASDDAALKKGKAKEEGAGTIGRKKRTFWGRRTHPDLIMNPSGIIEKGTFESLVHEAVFATTFLVSDAGDSRKQDADKSDNRKRWHEFASSVLFSIPSIVDRQAFELEFTRCCSYLVSGAEDEAKDVQRSSVAWLANEYLTYHGQPVDVTAWNQWKQEAIPGASLTAETATYSSGLPVSSSTQAIHHPSPLVNNASPNINTFSPRPEDNPQTLLDALFPAPTHEQQSRTSRPILACPSIRFPWATLNEEGLSKDLLFLLDPYLIAHSLTLYHRSVLDQCPENLTTEFITGREEFNSNEENEFISISSSSSSNSLFGSDDRPHWLTKLLLLQILGTETSSVGQHNPSSSIANQLSSPVRRSEDRNGSQTSRTHSRSEVISIWTKVGELCRLAGDECSWRAISAALCSRPVSRLDKTWKRVDPQALSAIESWAHASSDKENISVGQPQVTPWGGDVKVHIVEELGKARGDNGDSMINTACIVKARSLFDQFRTSFLLCPRKSHVMENEISEDARRLAAYWRDLAADGGGASSMAVKFQRLEQFMSLSLATEPRRKGLFEPYFWTRSIHTHTSYTSLIPLLFPDPLPTLTLVDKSKLVRGRLESDASEMQYLRSVDAQLRQEAGRNLHNLDANQDYIKRLILGTGGTVISLHNGNLRLVVQSGTFEAESTTSRPSSKTFSRPPSSVVDHGSEKNLSRNPSIRVKPSTSQGLDRKTSVARRSSLPSVSLLSRQNLVTSEPSLDPPLRVVVQAGTLNNLVDVLVHGLEGISVSVADDNGEMSLREGMKREVVIDRVEFARVWWNVFRSFVSPFVFFELLRKIYSTAQQPAGSSPSASDHRLLVARTRNEVLVAMQEWLTIGGGAQDILDDVQLYNTVQSFLETETEVDKLDGDNNPIALEQAWESLLETKRSLKLTFISQTMRPTISRGFHNVRPQGSNRGGARTRGMSARDPPDLDRMDPEDFVDNLEGMAGAAFSNVTQEDLYITADLLEVQTSDRTGWFSSRDVSSFEESVEIQTIYSHIQEIEPSSMISELTQDALYRLLPPGVRSCIRAYGIIRKWLISKIVTPRLGLRTRQARMELLIQAIEVSRLRNSESTSSSSSLTAQHLEQPCVRSFVEAVTTSALLSVESRMHHRAWQGVAFSRGCPCDSLSSLLLRPYIECTSSNDSLTVDMGWLLERMLEVIATPDIIEPTFQDLEGQTLVNFDKRRHLCNLISKSSSLTSGRKNIYSDESNRRGFDRLNNIEKEVLTLQFDHRGIKEEAVREAAANPGMNGGGGGLSTKKAIRPFHKVVAIQIEKNRRDKNLRIRLQREKLQEQSKIERRDDLLNKAMRPRKQPLSIVQKQNRNKKSMSAFLSFMRPISSAFGAEIPQPPGLKRTPSELDFHSTSKPSLVLSVMDAQVAQFINNERSYTFQLDTDDGGHYLLQAMTKREMNKWLETISRVTKMAAKRRLTYLGPKPQISDHIHSTPIVASRDPKAVFGVELEFLLRRETGSENVPWGTVPTIIEQCLSEVESRGLSEVGIYRIAGAITEINSLKDAYNRGEYPIRESTDIHAICDLVKSWFRVLPEPVFPPSSYHDVMDAMKLENLDKRLLNIRRVVQGLPQANLDILRRVSEHLDKVTDYEEHNHMTAEALAIVFSPNLLRAPQNDFVMILNNMGLSHKLVKALITHFHVIFDEADPEGDAPSEDELDSPILEEDEDELEEEEDPKNKSFSHGLKFDTGN